MLRAIIFDFDGILVDSEPLIFKLTQQMAAREGWTVTEDDYYVNYLALDDRGVVEHLYQSHGRPVDSKRRDELIAWKFRAYQEIIRDGLPPMPGAVAFVQQVAARFQLAIASGSLRSEIEHLLGKLGLREKFAALATADDCATIKARPGGLPQGSGEASGAARLSVIAAHCRRVPGHRGCAPRGSGRACRRNEMPGAGP